MKNFSELLATDLRLLITVNGQTTQADLNQPLTFSVNDCVTVDGIEILPKYQYLAVDNKLYIDQPFYQWLHHASDQGWLLKPVKDELPSLHVPNVSTSKHCQSC